MPPKTKPKITPEGQAAANRIAEARQNVDLGATPAEARKTVRQIEAGPKGGQVITPENLQPTNVITPVTPEIPTEGARLNAETTTVVDDFTQELADQKKLAETNKNSSLSSYIASLTGSPTETQLTDTLYSAAGGVDDIQKELNVYKDKLRKEKRSLELQTRSVLESGGQSKAQANAQIKNLERKSLQEQADLMILQMGVQDQYDSAKDIADRSVDIQLEQQKLVTEAAKLTYEDNKDLFTTAEQREFDTLLANRNRLIEEESERLKEIKTLAVDAMRDGAPKDVVSKMLKAKTLEEATSIGGSFIGALDREAKRASINSSYASARNSLISSAKSGDPQAIAQLGFDPNKTTPLGEYSNIIDTASLLVGAERGQETRRAMASAIERGDYQTTYSMLANNVQSSLQGESASRFGSARTDIQVLGGLREVINEFEQAGGDTGFLVGNADQIARKFGQLATDPKFAALAVQLEREFQAYRQAMTGAAFGPAESAEYEKVNPSSTKSLELNLATIDGALRQLENRVVGTTEAYVPGSREIYDLATGKEKVVTTNDPSKEPIGSVIEIGGVRYRKVGDDAYEPI